MGKTSIARKSFPRAASSEFQLARQAAVRATSISELNRGGNLFASQPHCLRALVIAINLTFFIEQKKA
ncbi:MAG: hypothetical protein ABMA01_21400 [Chthoniobacteraceae bacterium]